MWAGMLIILLNVVVFVISNEYLSPSQLETFLNMYGLSPNTLDKPLNWVTTMFLHANLSHIVMNMLALFSCLVMLQGTVKGFSFLILYFICGLFGSLFGWIYIEYAGAFVNIIGASGAVIGMWAFASVVTRSFTSFISQMFMYHLLIIVLKLPVAWYVHLGGFLIGALLGGFARISQYERKMVL